MVMICVLALAAISNTSAVPNHRALLGEDKGNGNVREPQELVSSPPPISPLIGNHSPTDQGHNLPLQSYQSPAKSANSDSGIPRSPPPLVDSSQKLLPPPGPENLNPGGTTKAEDMISQKPPNKEENKTPEDPKKEENKAPENPKKEENKAPEDPKKEGKTPLQSPEKADHKAPQTPNKETSKSGERDEKNSKNESCETANASTLTCRTGGLIACLFQPGTESTKLFLIVQNTGEDDLYVNITSPGKIKIDSKTLDLPKQSNKKVNITADTSMGLKIILSTSKGDCVLQTMTPTPDWLSLQQFPAYAAQVRPMHGAYFLFAVIIIVGGTWAFCKYGKKEKRADTGIPYQRIEMATQTRSASAPAHVIPTDNWDQGWDDNWDDEESVVRTSAKKPAEDVSPNGRSSRPENTNQNGWEIDWDD